MSKIDVFTPSDSLKNFSISANDAGYIYVIKNQRSFKIGRSIRPKKRLREAKTWIPEHEVVGIKPFWNHRRLENSLHVGLAQFWKQQEWYDFGDDEFLDYFLDEFRAFADDDINKNSINFGYMMNGTGMAELISEQVYQGASKSLFLKETSQNHEDN